MSSKLKPLIYICIIAGLVLGALGIGVRAAFNEEINFQGKLTDNDNIAVPDSDYNFEFGLWNDATSTATSTDRKWVETCTSTNKITVTSGLFSHLLGSVTALDDSIFNQNLWLEVAVGGTSTEPSWEYLSPRKKLGAVPAAFEAKRLEGLLSSQLLRSDATDTMQASSSDAILTVRQDGLGNIVDFKIGATSTFVIDNSGEITTGEWKATAIGTQWGGTGQDWSATTWGSIPYFSATGTMAALGPGTSGYFLKTLGAGVDPQWAEVTGGANYYGPTIIVAASNSTNTSRANYQADGTADNVEIQQAIDALPAGIGGTVLLLEGTYSVTSTINIVASSTSLIGSGKSTILTRAADAFAMITVGDGGTTTVAGVVIANLQIDGQKGTYTDNSNQGIYFNQKVTESQIRNNWIHDNYGDSIYLFTLSNNNLIEGNEMINDTVSFNAGVSVVSSSAYNVISANIVVKHGGVGGIRIWSDANNNVISGNNVQESNQDGIYVSSGSYNTISGNTVQGNGYNGIYLKGNDSYANTVTGNTSKGNTWEGIHVREAPYTSVVGNTVYNNGRDGIELEYPQNSVVSSNSIYDSTGSGYYGINISNTSANNNYIIGNEISGNYDAEIRDDGIGTTIQQRDWFEIEPTTLSVNYPGLLIGSADTSWATGTETYLGIAATSTFSGNLVDFQKAGTSVFKIDASGNVATGTWQGTAIAAQYGGTGQDWSTAATGSLPFATSTGVFDLLAPGTSGQVLTTQGAGASPTWSLPSDKKGPTLIVAASNSKSTSTADYVCTGTNDQEKINEAIGDLPAGIGGTVKLLEGHYFIASSTDNIGINITTSSVSLIGSGKGTILHRDWDSASDDGVIEVGDGGTPTSTGVVIANLSIDGCKATSTESACKDAYFAGATQNIGIYFNQKVTQSRIQNTWIHDCDGSGIHLYGTSGNENSQNLIEGNDVRNNDYEGIKLEYSLNNTILGNNTQNNDYRGIVLSYSSNNAVLGNNIQGNNEEGIVFSYSSNNTFSGNNIRGNGSGTNPGVYLSRAHNNTITGNIVYDNDGAEIHLYESDYNIISSNNVWDDSGYGINISDSDSNDNYLIGNEISGMTTEISDSGTGTTIQQRDWFEIEASTLSVNYPGLLIGSADTSWATGTETYLGIAATSTFSGKLVDLQKAGTSKFVIDSDGYVTTGEWQATAIGTQYGGTGQDWSTAATGSLPFATSTGVFDLLAPGTSGQVLTTQGAGASPTWSAPPDKKGPTLIVAASNSNNTSSADYVCDGIADNVEIQQAIDALPAGIGGTVLLLEGTYNVTSSITITTSSVALIGSGKATKLDREWNATPTDDGVITVGDGTNSYDGIVIANLQINGCKAQTGSCGGAYTSGSYNIGIYFNKNISQSRILNTWIHDCDGTGIYLYGTSGNENTDNLVEGNDVRDNDYNGMKLNYSYYSHVLGNRFDNNDYIHGVGLFESDYNIVSGNNITRNQGENSVGNISLNSSNYNIISSNYLKDSNYKGIYVYSSSNSNVITDNIIYNSGQDEIWIENSDNNIISSNRVWDDSGDGIEVNSGSNNYIIGNEISGVTTEIVDSGTGTTIQQRDWFEVEASSTIAALTVSQSGTGNIVDFKIGATSTFVINNSGEITTGEWKATAIGTQYGGTGQDWSTAATGSVPFATSTGVFDLLAPGTSGQVLTTQGAGASPTWSAPPDKKGPTLIVAASNSKSTSTADYVCTGTNDQEKINEAIGDLPAGIGGTVLLLEGTYNIATSTNNLGINVTTSSVALIGSGNATILKRASNSDTDDGVISVGDGGTTTVAGVVIANLQIDGQRLTYGSTNNHGIYFNKKVTRSKIQNTWINDIRRYGIYLYGTSGNTNDYNLIQGNDLPGSAVGGGMRLEYSNYNSISDNRSSPSSGHAIYLSDSSYNRLTGNAFTGSSDEGVYLSSDSNSNSIIGNRISASNYYAFRISTNNNTIIGNVISGSGSYDAVRLWGDNNVFSSNYISSAPGQYGIDNSSNNNYIIGNEIVGTDSKINVSGGLSTIQQRDWFEIEQTSTSSSQTVLTVAQSGTGNIVDFKVGTTSAFVIDNSGEITTGEWKATAIGTQWGGTGQDWSTAATGSVPFATSTGVFDLLAPGTSGQVLTAQGAGASPTWSAPSDKKGPTLIVAASNSKSTSTADYVCTGTNDQEKINEAIGDLPAGIGGTVLLLEGTYLIASSTNNIGINITTSSISLIGSGKGTILHRDWDASSNDGVIEVGDGGTAAVEGVVIANLSMDGCKATSTESACKDAYAGFENSGIYFNQKVTQSRIQNTWIHDCDAEGINFYGSTTYKNRIEGNDIRDNNDSGWGGVCIYYSTDNVIIGNNVQSNDLIGIILMEAANNNTVSGNTISNTIGSVGGGIYIRSSYRNTVSGNSIDSNAYYGIYFKYDDCGNNTISGNTISNNTDSGIYNDRCDGNTIAGNTIYNNGSGEIEFTGAANNNVISSNNIWDNSGTGIEIGSGGTNNYIIGNEIYGVPTEISDSGTGTTIQQRDWFEVEASSTIAALTVSQSGSGNIVEFIDATTTVFTIANGGNVTVAGDILPATTTTYSLGSSTYKWANLYAATTTIGETITIGTDTFTGSGTTTISTDAGSLTLNPSGIFKVIIQSSTSSDSVTDYFNDYSKVSAVSSVVVSGGVAKLAEWACGDSVSFTYKGESATYYSTSSQGECWLDRNLGAAQVATAYNDSNAYGDLFQWGRLDDGHQARTSGTTTATSSSDDPGHNNFIYGMGSPYDWRSPKNDNMWKEDGSGINNPCPDGWRLPTETEWDTERASWSPINRSGAYASPLKLTAGGNRYYSDATFKDVGSIGYYWSSTVSGTDARHLIFGSATAFMANMYRASGYSVRCLNEVLADYYATGTLISTNLLSGETDTVDSIDSFYYDASSVPVDTNLKVQFATSSTSGPWYNSAGAQDSWDQATTTGGDTIDLSGLSWSGANFYYKMQFDSDASNTTTSILTEIKVNYTISQGGGNSMIVDSSGNVGIGTASPDYNLDVSQIGNSGGHLYLDISSGNNFVVRRSVGQWQIQAKDSGDVILVQDAGNVGVGTTTPAALLDVYASSTATALTVSQSGNGNIVDFKDGGTSVFTIADGGGTLASGTKAGVPYGLISDEATTNLVVNPSFENNVTDGWATTTVATTTQETGAGNYYIGSASMKIETPGSVTGEGAETATSSVATSTTYTASAFLKGESATTTVQMKLIGDASGTTTSNTITLSTAFIRYNLSKTTTSTDTTLKLQIVTAATSSAVFYVDGVQLEQKSYPTTYCDGSLGPGYSWSGTIHNSTSTRTAGFRYLNPSKQFVLDTNGNLGVGSAAPVRRLEVKDTSDAQLRLTQEDASKYVEFEVNAAGNLTVSLSGDDFLIPDDNLWVCESGGCGISISGTGNLVVENYAYFAGSKVMYPSELGRPKRSIILTAAGAIAPDTNPASQTKVSTATSTYYVLDYADATTSSAFWEWVMPDSYATGTIDVTIYWTATSTNPASSTVWGIKTVGIDEGENINTALGNTTTTTCSAPATANYLKSATSTNFASYAPGWEPEDYIIFEVYRDGTSGSDNLEATARLVKVKIEYSVKQESD